MNNVLRTAAAVAALSLFSGIASADRYPEPDSPTVQVQKSTVTRAETQADLQIWQESGLAAFDRLDGISPATTPGYEAAVARYEFLRASERFAELTVYFASRKKHLPRQMIDLSSIAPRNAGLTRAEVRAELEAWRDAGLTAFERSSSNASCTEVEYQAAKARYAQLLQIRGLGNAPASSRQG